MLRLAGQPSRAMPAAAAVPLAVYTVTRFVPQASPAAGISFVVFSVMLLWYAVLMLRAYSAGARPKVTAAALLCPAKVVESAQICYTDSIYWMPDWERRSLYDPL